MFMIPPTASPDHFRATQLHDLHKARSVPNSSQPNHAKETPEVFSAEAVVEVDSCKVNSKPELRVIQINNRNSHETMHSSNNSQGDRTDKAVSEEAGRYHHHSR